MKERLKFLRKTLGLNQQEFADKIGVNRGTLANYEVGRNVPIDAVIALICDRCHVNENWLRTGEGEMYVDKKDDDDIKSRVDSLKADDDLKRRLVAAILRLDNAKLKDYLDWIKLTFNLVDAPAADQDDTPAAESTEDQKEREIQAKLASYEAELRAEAASGKSRVSQVGNANGDKDMIVSAG